VKTIKPPKFLPKSKPFDKKLEWAGTIALGFSWGFSLYVFAVYFGDLPQHFDAARKPDSYGNKIAVLALPLVATLLFIGMNRLNRYPEIFNYPVKITDRNRESEYRAAMRTIRGMKLAIVLAFLLIVLDIYITDHTADSSANFWLLPGFLLLSFAPLIIYFATAKKRIKP